MVTNKYITKNHFCTYGTGGDSLSCDIRFFPSSFRLFTEIML